MSNLISLAKSAPVIVMCAVGVLVSFALVIYVAVAGTGSMPERWRTEAGKTLGQIQSLMRTPVEVPPENPGDEPETVEIAVNQAAIDDVVKMYAEMREQKRIMSETVEQRNQRRQMVKDLFPPKDKEGIKQATAAQEYFDRLAALLAPTPTQLPAYHDDPARTATLRAGMPPSPADMQKLVETTYKEFRNSHGLSDNAAIPDTLRDKAEARAQKELLDMLSTRAAQINLYAQLDRKSNIETFWCRVPQVVIDQLQGEQWVAERDLIRLWEAQMALWMYEDVVHAIALANKNVDGGVALVPVKRLIRVSAQPRYVGVNTGGLVTGTGEMTAYGLPAMATEEMPTMGDAAMEDYGPPVIEEAPAKAIELDYSISHTGRVSNEVYDVRHVKLEAIVDFAQLPLLFDAIQSVNFMTVLNCRIEQVDEFDALREGFVYGSGDCVKVEMIIESIWMRDWLVGDPNSKKGTDGFRPGLMPDDVREVLGLERRQARKRTGGGTTTGTIGTPGSEYEEGYEDNPYEDR